MADVLFKEVTKRFGSNVVAVNDVNMTIPDGEMVVFVGSSGCGKTTTLRMLAGLERISSGQIRIGGRLANNLTPMQRNIAMVFQNYALYPHMTVRENMAFPLQAQRVTKPAQQQRIAEVAELLDISPLLDRTPRQLSGGQQQRVALGRAVVRDPDVLLMDEPLSNLDAKLRVRMRSEIKSFQRRVGVTTVYVTHDQTEAMTMGDRIAVMMEGRLEQFDTPAMIYTRPANSRVAQLVGTPTMNLFPGVLQADGDGLVIRSEQLTIPVPESQAATMKKAAMVDKVQVGVRPEALSLRAHRAASGSVQRIGTGLVCASSEVLGSTAYYRLEHFPDSTISVEDRPDRDLREFCAPGEMSDLYLEPDSIHLFDINTGDRLA